MSKYIVDGTDLTGIADAIRAKTGSTSLMSFPTGFTNQIASISSAPEVKIDVNYGTALTPSQGSISFRTKSSGQQPRFVTPVNVPTGKNWILKSVNSLSVYGIPQTIKDFAFEMDYGSSMYWILIYSATGETITVDKPSYGAEMYIRLSADVFEVDL